MTNTYAIVLSAGQGTRMKSDLYKVLHPVCGKPMVEHVVDTLSGIGAERIVAIVGHGAEKVEETLSERCEYALQEEQLGTAHAVQQAERLLGGAEGTTIVVCGDTPLIKPETFEAMIAHHKETGAKATILTAHAEDPTGYGRIIRNEEGHVIRNVEQKDATPEEQAVTEINSGTYCFDNAALFEALKKVKNDNAQGEYYLPDVIGILKSEGQLIAAYVTDDFTETIGVNDRAVLSVAEKVMRERIADKHMRAGVTIIDPASSYISADAVIGRDTVIQPMTMIEGPSVIGTHCTIGPSSHIQNSVIGDHTTIHSSVIRDSKIGSRTAIGPFAHIRPDSSLSDNVKIGNFVEVKKSEVGEGSKISHLSYIGDAELGTDVNVGCGTITVNYDGKNKNRTIIGDKAFVGCNSNLIAPVEIKQGAYVAAGSTITKDVPEHSLAIGRARQENKEGYATKLNLN